MSLIGSLVSFVPGAKAVSADVNANFSAIRSAFNTSAVLNDIATTITVAHTISASPGLIFSAGTSRLVPGVTSFAIRNNANTADNLLVSDAGLVTARAGVVSTLGGVSLIANNPTSGLVVGRSAPLGDRMLEITGQMAQAATEYGAFFHPTFDSFATAAGEVLAIQLNTAANLTQTASRGIRIYNPVQGAGSSITTLYGLQIDSQTAGGTNFAISTGSGRVSFGDNVTCAAALNVAGTMTVSTALSAPTLVVTTAGTVGAVALGINNDTTSGFYIASGGVQVAASGTNVSDMRASLWQAAVKARAVAGFIVGNGATLATSATVGYLYVPTMPGTATGVPTIGAVETGTVALAFDTTNNRLQIYNSGWKTVLLA